MRKNLLVILLLLVVLIVLVVTRCGGKKDQQNDPADNQGFTQQSGKAELPAELKLGVVTETESAPCSSRSSGTVRRPCTSFRILRSTTGTFRR